MPLTKEQFQKLRDQGLSVEQIVSFESGKTPTPVADRPTEAPQHGVLRSIVEDPVKTLLVKPADRFAEMLGRTGLLGDNIKTGYESMSQLGQGRTFGGVYVEPQKAFGEGGGKQILGDAAKSASYLYGGGKAVSAVGTGLKGQVIAGALTGAKAGAVGGGLYSFGDAVQQAESQPSDVAYKTLFGAVAGGVTGGLIGATTPLVVKGINAVNSYRDFQSLEGKLNERNRQILKPTSTQLSDWAQAKVDPIKTFTREFGPQPIPSYKDTLKLDDMISQVDTKYKAGAEGFNTILRNSPETVSLSQTFQQANANINASSLTPASKQKALEKLATEFHAIIGEAAQSGKLLGKDNVPAWYADNLKDRFWGATKNFGSEESTVANSVNKSIGFGFKEGIENAVKDVNVKAYNKQLQELITLKDFLETRNGKVPGSGGKMTRMMTRVLGGIAGSGGGPVGSAVGSLTADKVAQAIISPETSTWLIRRQLEKLSPEARATLQQEAEQIIQNMTKKRLETLRLGSGATSGFDISPTAMKMFPPFSVEGRAGRVFNQSNLEGTGRTLIPKNAGPMITPPPKP